MSLQQLAKPLHWFDQKFSTKESLQSFVVMAFIVLIIITKCYTLIAPQQKADSTQQQKSEFTQNAVTSFTKQVHR